MAKPAHNATLAQYEWLVERRSQIQRTSLKLFRQMERIREAELTNDNALANVAITLVAVSFSLWRAVFLCSEASVKGFSVIFEGAREFLETVIADNAISYPQDKRARDWSAIYYLNNAQFRLEIISQEMPEILDVFKADFGLTSYTSTFNRIQAGFDTAVDNFEKLITELLKSSRAPRNTSR